VWVLDCDGVAERPVRTRIAFISWGTAALLPRTVTAGRSLHGAACDVSEPVRQLTCPEGSAAFIRWFTLTQRKNEMGTNTFKMMLFPQKKKNVSNSSQTGVFLSEGEGNPTNGEYLSWNESFPYHLRSLVTMNDLLRTY